MGTRQTAPGLYACSEFMSPADRQHTLRANKERADAGEQTTSDILYSCMAQRGWSYTGD